MPEDNASQVSYGFCPQCGAALAPGARFCPSCGAQLAASGAPASAPATNAAPNSGTAQPRHYTPTPRQTYTPAGSTPSTASSVPLAGEWNLFAIIALVCSILSFFTGSLSIVFFIAGFVLSILSRNQFKQYGDAAGKGQGLATAALVISIISLVLILVTFVGCAALLGAASSYNY